MMKPLEQKFNLLIGIVIVVGTLGILVALRFLAAPVHGSLDFIHSSSGDDYPNAKRGEQVATSKDDFAEFRFSDGTVVMLDSDTVVRLDATSPENVITLIQGRIVIKDGTALVKARNLELEANNCVLVHYSWLDLLDAVPLSENGCDFVDDEPDLLARMTTKFSTVDASIKGVSDFAPQNSSAEGFFDWAGLMGAQPSAPVVGW